MTLILKFVFPAQHSILAISTCQSYVYKDDRFLSTIIQSNLTENLANVTEQYARNALFKANDLVKILHTKAVKLRSCKKKKSDKISAISDREATLALRREYFVLCIQDIKKTFDKIRANNCKATATFNPTPSSQ